MVHLRFPAGIRFMQYAAALNATLSMTCCALYLSWSSPTIPQLTSENSPIGTTITSTEASWVASAFSIGYIPGGIISGWILSKLGPKITLLVSTVPTFVPWIAVVFAKSAWVLCVTRFVAGVGLSIAAATAPIYTAEVSDTDIRGKLGTTAAILYFVGSLFVLSVGPFISYTLLAICCSVFPLLFGATFWFMPDSPYYLVKKNRLDAAHRNIIRLSAQNADQKQIQAQLDEVTRTIEYDVKNKSPFWELFTIPENRRLLIVIAGVRAIQQLSGIAAVEAYMQTIIASSRSSISPEFSSVIFGAIQMFSAILSGALVDKAGRKPLLIISTLGCALALSIEGIYFYLHESAQHAIVDSLSWLPTSALVSYLILYSVGLGPLSTVILSEIFPANIKNHAASFYVVFGGLLSVFVTLAFDPVSQILGIYFAFFIFAAFCVVGSVFIFVALPETKGKTFVEIQSSFNISKPLAVK